MLVLNGKYNHARIMTDKIDEATRGQILNFLDHPAFGKAPIVIMSDCHAGAGAVIGFTMPVRRHIVPNVVGVDLGCGVNAYNLGKIDIDLPEFDRFIKLFIPAGHLIHREPHRDSFLTAELERSIYSICQRVGESYGYIMRSVGTLGGGNHYIELDRDKNGHIWLVIHSGSRHFGLKVAHYHQRKAKELMRVTFQDNYRDLEYLPAGYGMEEYLADAKVAQEYASYNRSAMASIILDYLGINQADVKSIKSVHNYIGRDNIIRKGAISACKNEELIIPLNMRDGAILGIGKGNANWNNSAPHGAGRLYSRKKAKEKFALAEYQAQMDGIWTSCVSKATLDESPMAYKDPKDILSNLSETVEITDIIRPIYNFKASD